jgi:hypothetical protein
MNLKMSWRKYELCRQFFFQYVTGRFGDMFRGALFKVGNYVPIRGVASVAADFGIPGGEFVLEALTPTSSPPAPKTPSVEPRCQRYKAF